MLMVESLETRIDRQEERPSIRNTTRVVMRTRRDRVFQS